MNEPDRPRRDVSIEEAERMPMSDEELDAIDERARYGTKPKSLESDVLALVAEVRRLRARLDIAQTAYLSVRQQVDDGWLRAERMENDAYVAGWNAAVAHGNPKMIHP